MKPAFRFARGGKVYKELEADEAHLIQSYLRTGIISPSDDYWSPGMGDWKKVSSRIWNAPAPENQTGNQLPPAQAAEAAQSAASLAASVTPIVGRTHNCECTTCKKGFNTPEKAPSGYSVIGKAAMFFCFGFGLLFLVYALNDKLLSWAVRSDSQVSYVMVSCVSGIVALAGLGLLLMSLFELIAAAVTHGIYRANPERCPHCKSPTFLKKMSLS